MKELQASEVRSVQEQAMDAIQCLQSIVKECESLYQSRRYIIAKADDAMAHAKMICAIAKGDN